jgi:hypothetical protein
MLILGIGYKARQGKGTAAQAIIDSQKAELDIRGYGFGDALKREVNAAAVEAGGMFALFNELALTGAPLPGGQRIKIPDWVKYEPEPDMTDPLSPLGKHRTLLQWWGSEYRRAQDSFYWVKAMRDTLKAEMPQVAVISDMRFKNEMLWVKANQGFTIKVSRLGFNDFSTNPSHHSESELDNAPFDFEIQHSEGDVGELEKCAVEVFGMIRKMLEPQVEEVAA